MLQQLLIDKIDNYKGLDHLTDFLTKQKRITKQDDKIYFTNLIQFYNLLYTTNINVEQQTIDSKVMVTKTLHILTRYNKNNPKEEMQFCIDTLIFSLNYISNIKGLF